MDLAAIYVSDEARLLRRSIFPAGEMGGEHLAKTPILFQDIFPSLSRTAILGGFGIEDPPLPSTG